MKSYRPHIALILVYAFAFNMLGYCMFSIIIVTHKGYVFNKILTGDIANEELYSFNVTELKNASWEDKREFELNGEMYDVVKKEDNGSKTIYTCKKDAKEDFFLGQKRRSAEKTAACKMMKMTKIFVQAKKTNHFSFIPLIQIESFWWSASHYHYYSSGLVNPPPKA